MGNTEIKKETKEEPKKTKNKTLIHKIFVIIGISLLTISGFFLLVFGACFIVLTSSGF